MFTGEASRVYANAIFDDEEDLGVGLGELEQIGFALQIIHIRHA